MSTHTGFKVTYDKGEVWEKDRYVNRGKTYATNWHTVDRTRIQQLELYWKGKQVAELKRQDDTKDWVFFLTGATDLFDDSVEILFRTIGIVDTDGQTHKVTVEEKTGEITRSKG
jgi:hypothetical protein